MLFAFVLCVFYFCVGVSATNATSVDDRIVNVTVKGTEGNVKQRVADELNCIFQLNGKMSGQYFSDDEEVIQCEPGVKFCQKVTAHYYAVGSETKITMRGCDDLQIPDIYEGIACMQSGCSEQTVDMEIYTVCCCTDHLCNGSSFNYLISSFLMIILVFII